MPTLYTVQSRHHAPKDSHTAIHAYVLADSETAIRDRLNEATHDSWSDEDDHEIYDDEYNVTGTETYMEFMLRVRGDMNDADKDYADSYYGITVYGWDEGRQISVADAETLTRLGMAQRWEVAK